MNCCAWTQAAVVFALPVVSMLMLKLPTRDNMESAAHNSVCDTKRSGCRHASRVSWSLGPDLRQLFECHRNNVNDVQPSHAPTQTQRCCNVLFLHRRLRLLPVCANVWTSDWTKTWRNVKKPRIKQQKSFESQSGCSADHPLAIKGSKECGDERCQEKLHLSVQLRSFGVTESLRTKLEGLRVC